MADEVESNPVEATPATDRSPAGPEEKRERLATVREMMGRGCSDWEVKRVLAPQFGVSRAHVGRMIAEVRRQLREEFDPTKFDELLKGTLEFYRGIYSDVKQPTQARIRAMENAAKMLGLYVPRVEVAHDIADAGLRETLKTVARQQLTEAELSKLIEASEIAKRIGETDEEGGD